MVTKLSLPYNLNQVGKLNNYVQNGKLPYGWLHSLENKTLFYFFQENESHASILIWVAQES